MTSQETIARLKHFTLDQINSLDKQHIPQHIAIIPDGNRRWAAQASLNPTAGHGQGSKVVLEVVEASAELGIKTLTIYTFSTENWLRSEQEVGFLMDLLAANIIQYRDQMKQNGVRLETIGDLSAFPEKIQHLLADAKEATKDGTTLTLVLAINYGARDEMRRAVKRIAEDCKAGNLATDAIQEQTISNYLDTAPFGDPDLFIRTSGELRISNFLLWQLSYTELYMPQVLWPDFGAQHLLEATLEFQRRKRRFGL